MKIQSRILISLLILLWCSGIFFQFFAKLEGELMFLYPYIKKMYSLVCHQETNKLIIIGDIQSLTCARCTGIYFGFLFLSVLNIFIGFEKSPKIKFFLLFSVPMLLDVLFYSTGVYHYSKSIAFISGFLFGSTGFLYFYNGIKTLFNEVAGKELNIVNQIFDN